MRTPPPLLPSGFADLLPPYAYRERQLRSTVMEHFRRFGYMEVTPPLAEFEESLLVKSSLDRQTFRVLDAESQRMMGLRADMTPQIARIAASRMQNEPLPLRLCYSGTCLRVQGVGTHKSRQLVQAGAECIGKDDDSVLIELLRCADEALNALTVDDISLDISLPGLTEELLQPLKSQERDTIRIAIKQKDRHTIQQLEDSSISQTLLQLLDGTTLEFLQDHQAQLPASMERWLQFVQAIQAQLPQLTLTLDPLEENGFGYYDGIVFSIFSKKLGAEIGRGGRYIAHDNLPAYGFTLYLTSLIYEGEYEEETTRCLVAAGANEEKAKECREKGWHTLYASAKSAAELTEEAQRFACDYLLQGENVTHV